MTNTETLVRNIIAKIESDSKDEPSAVAEGGETGHVVNKEELAAVLERGLKAAHGQGYSQGHDEGYRYALEDDNDTAFARGVRTGRAAMAPELAKLQRRIHKQREAIGSLQDALTREAGLRELGRERARMFDEQAQKVEQMAVDLVRAMLSAQRAGNLGGFSFAAIKKAAVELMENAREVTR